jgi:nucleoside-diphosphate-sugar epimerase
MCLLLALVAFWGQNCNDFNCQDRCEPDCCSASICSAPCNAGFEAQSLDANTDWSTSFSDLQVAIHTAARVHVMKEGVNDPLMEYRHVNVEGTFKLARQAAVAGVKRFVVIS